MSHGLCTLPHAGLYDLPHALSYFVPSPGYTICTPREELEHVQASSEGPEGKHRWDQQHCQISGTRSQWSIDSQWVQGMTLREKDRGREK